MTEKYVIFLYIFTYIVHILAYPRITKLECEVNDKICTNHTCFIGTKRKIINLINVGCDLQEPITHFKLKFVGYNFSGNKTIKFLDATEDGCQILANAFASPIVSRIFAIISKFMTLPKRCPFKGKYYLNNVPIQANAIPPYLVLPGNYSLMIDVFGTGLFRNESVIKQTYYGSLV